MHKKTNKILLISALTVLVITTILVVLISYETHDNTQTDDNVYTIIADDQSVMLKYNDKVIKIYDINVSVLPPQDVMNLQNGIIVSSPEAADRIIEDYDG